MNHPQDRAAIAADGSCTAARRPGNDVQRQVDYVATLPPKRGQIVRKALSGAATPRQAIKAKCLTCANFEVVEIAQCTVWRCPLHSYRPYQARDVVGKGDAP